MPIYPALLPACLAFALVPLTGPALLAAPSPGGALPPASSPQTAAAPPGAPAALPPAIVDPAARALYMQMVNAQKALHSYAITIDAQDQSAGAVVPRSRGHSRIAFSAPARAVVTLAQQNKMLGALYSDGTTFTRVDTQHKSYRQDTLPAAAAARIVTTEIGNLGLLPHSYADPGGLLGLLSASGLVAVARGTVSGPVDGVPVDSVVARLVGSDTAEGTFTFVIGQSDHLLRQVIVHEVRPAGASGPARSRTHTETITTLEVNPALPASAFAYKPGAGFKKLTSPH